MHPYFLGPMEGGINLGEEGRASKDHHLMLMEVAELLCHGKGCQFRDSPGNCEG